MNHTMTQASTPPLTAGMPAGWTARAATRAASAVTANWANPRKPMPATLPASRLRAGIRASSTSTTRLLFSSATPVSTRLPYKTMAMSSSTLMMMAAIALPVLRPADTPSCWLLHGHRGHDRVQLAGIDPGGGGPLLDGHRWMAAVTIVRSCPSGWPRQVSLRVSTTSTAMFWSRTAFSPAATPP